MERYRQDAQFGTVIEFEPGLTREQVEKIVLRIREIEGVEMVHNVNGFDPQWGGPVWYIP